MDELEKFRKILSEQEWQELVSITLSTRMTLEEIQFFFPHIFRPK